MTVANVLMINALARNPCFVGVIKVDFGVKTIECAATVLCLDDIARPLNC